MNATSGTSISSARYTRSCPSTSWEYGEDARSRLSIRNCRKRDLRSEFYITNPNRRVMYLSFLHLPQCIIATCSANNTDMARNENYDSLLLYLSNIISRYKSILTNYKLYYLFQFHMADVGISYITVTQNPTRYTL